MAFFQNRWTAPNPGTRGPNSPTLHTGDVLRATVNKTVQFGALIEAEGVPGVFTGTDKLWVGDSVQGRIGTLDQAKQRFSLIGG
jgi:ribosomal protein S1